MSHRSLHSALLILALAFMTSVDPPTPTGDTTADSSRADARKPVPAAMSPGVRTGNRRFRPTGHLNRASSGLIKG